MPNLPANFGGSWSCAIDPIEEILYTVGISSLFNLYTYDINAQTWETKGKTFIMDTVTGFFEERWAFPEHYIHDLATMPLDENEVPDVDTDGDGIIDFYDEYPDDGYRNDTYLVN